MCYVVVVYEGVSEPTQWAYTDSQDLQNMIKYKIETNMRSDWNPDFGLL